MDRWQSCGERSRGRRDRAAPRRRQRAGEGRGARRARTTSIYFRFMRVLLAAITVLALSGSLAAQPTPATIVLQPDRVFDGETSHAGWVVVVRGDRIQAAGPAASTPAPAGARTIALPGTTVMPGLIEG